MIGLTRLSTTGGSFYAARTEQLAAKSSVDELLGISVGIAGGSLLRQDGSLTPLTAGNVTLYQAPSAWKLATEGTTETQMIKFSRDLLPPGMRDVRQSAQRLHVHSPATNMLARYLDQLDRSAPDLTAVQRADAGQAAIALVAMALRSPEAAAPDGSEVVILEMVKAYVRDHVSEPLLIEDLARRHHISVRYLYRVFEYVDTTPGAYIREQRLLAARNMLLDPRYVGLSIGRVAEMTGFPQARTFHRAFHREFGITPDSWRHYGNSNPSRALPGDNPTFPS
ncbi:AraC family transcriptional regulator [Actinoplanes sp. TBRC 11911]|uniref:AraC family transcriptional regulator n=1 Tax=Actinoplanes sp. TBRC 11911 TaxID=2729386 RepID=UPI00145D34C6|nr:AraC family transcriptional regulator [Actinoplanes sp. TBRC 11911]NMO50994.1 AraC family transcriptional regulator [Actinoplanes sp. TBRC 11911]